MQPWIIWLSVISPILGFLTGLLLGKRRNEKDAQLDLSPPKTQDFWVPMRNGRRGFDVQVLGPNHFVYHIDVGDVPPDEAIREVQKFRKLYFDL